MDGYEQLLCPVTWHHLCSPYSIRNNLQPADKLYTTQLQHLSQYSIQNWSPFFPHLRDCCSYFLLCQDISILHNSRTGKVSQVATLTSDPQLTTSKKCSSQCYSLLSSPVSLLPSFANKVDVDGLDAFIRSNWSSLISDQQWPHCSAAQAHFTASTAHTLHQALQAFSASALVILHKW